MHAREVFLRACARSRRFGDERSFVALFLSQVLPYRCVKESVASRPASGSGNFPGMPWPRCFAI